MSQRYHINKHGVPAICRAKPGNCPLGGDNEHFDSKEDAQKHADKMNEQAHSLLPTMSSSEPTVKFSSLKEFKQELTDSMSTFEGKYVNVSYDGKEYDGQVTSLFIPEGPGRPGFIVRGHDEHGAEQYKHIKIDRLDNIVDEDGQGPQGLLKATMENKEKVYGVETRNGFTSYQEFSLGGKNSIFSASGGYQLYGSKVEAEEEVLKSIEKERIEEQEKLARKERLDKYCKENFYSRPSMRDEELEVYKEDLAAIEKEINEKLKDQKGFRGIDFGRNADGNIYIRGFHSEVQGYSYGNQAVVSNTFEDKQEVIDNFVEMWKENDAKEKVDQYKRFIENGERYGWD